MARASRRTLAWTGLAVAMLGAAAIVAILPRIDAVPATSTALDTTEPRISAVPVERSPVAPLAQRGPWTLQGRVVCGSRPVPGAAVVIAWYSGTRRGAAWRIARADPSGAFECASLTAPEVVVLGASPGLYQPDVGGFDAGTRAPSDGGWPALLAAVDALERIGRVVSRPDGEDAATCELELREGCDVSGRVLAEGGGPAAGVEMTAVQPGEPRATTTRDGAFTLRGVLPRERVVLRARSGDGAFAETAVRVAEEGEMDAVVLQLRGPVFVRGTVRDERGALVPGACVEVWGRIPGEAALAAPAPIATARTDGEGRFALRCGGLADMLVLARTADGSECVAGVDPVGVRQTELILRAGLTLSGRVVSRATGEGIAAVEVRLGRPGYGWGTPPVRALTAEDGRFAIAGIHPETTTHRAWKNGRLDVVVAAKGHVAERRQVPLTQEREVVFSLEPSRTVCGVVRFRDGAPVAGAVVEAVHEDWDEPGAFDSPPESPRPAVTDDAGRFVVADVGAGPYRVDVWPGQRARRRFRWTSTGPVGGGSVTELVVEELRRGDRLDDGVELSVAALAREARSAASSRRDFREAEARWRALLARPLNDRERADAQLQFAVGVLRRLGRAAEEEEALRAAWRAARPGSSSRGSASLELARCLHAGPGRSEEMTAFADEAALCANLDSLRRGWARWLAIRGRWTSGNALQARRELEALRRECGSNDAPGWDVLARYVEGTAAEFGFR